MRFYLLKEKHVVFIRFIPPGENPLLDEEEQEEEHLAFAQMAALAGDNLKLRILRIHAEGDQIAPEGFELEETVSALIPMMSEKEDGNGFWNIETVDKCGSFLMNELMRTSSNCNRLNAVILVSYTLKDGRYAFSVSVENCDMLGQILNTCGDKAKLFVELYFKNPLSGEPLLAGLVTPEMDITSYKNEFGCKASDIFVTDIMGQYWKKNSKLCPGVQNTVYCNLVLIVNDDLPLFQIVRCSNAIRQILEEAIHSVFEIVSSDGAVIKCHKSFLLIVIYVSLFSVYSKVLGRMLANPMRESSSNRMKVEDMDKSLVVALLQYLYCKDLPDDFHLLYQLLKVAHKYEIDRLEQDTCKRLVQKLDLYFTDQFAWEVFEFTRNIPKNGKDLKEKMMNIIASDRAEFNVDFSLLVANDGSASCELMQWIFDERYGKKK